MTTNDIYEAYSRFVAETMIQPNMIFMCKETFDDICRYAARGGPLREIKDGDVFEGYEIFGLKVLTSGDLEVGEFIFASDKGQTRRDLEEERINEKNW